MELKKKENRNGIRFKKGKSKCWYWERKIHRRNRSFEEIEKGLCSLRCVFTDTNKMNLEKKKVLEDTDNQYEMHTRSTMDNMVVSWSIFHGWWITLSDLQGNQIWQGERFITPLQKISWTDWLLLTSARCADKNNLPLRMEVWQILDELLKLSETVSKIEYDAYVKRQLIQTNNLWTYHYF